jgi:hypothetical protein
MYEGKMNLESLSDLIDIFKVKLGDYGEYVQPSDLVSIGIFATVSEALRAIARKEIPALKITKKRILIPSLAVLEYLNKKAKIPKNEKKNEENHIHRRSINR